MYSIVLSLRLIHQFYVGVHYLLCVCIKKLRSLFLYRRQSLKPLLRCRVLNFFVCDLGFKPQKMFWSLYNILAFMKNTNEVMSVEINNVRFEAEELIFLMWYHIRRILLPRTRVATGNTRLIFVCT